MTGTRVHTTVLTRMISRLLFMPIMVASVAVLVKGYTSPGDGFSAGAIAAVGVLLQYVAFGYRATERLLPIRLASALAATGLLVALAVVFAPALSGASLLTHWPPPGEKPLHLGSLEVITAVLFDVGVYMLVLGFSVGSISAVAHILEGDPR